MSENQNIWWEASAGSQKNPAFSFFPPISYRLDHQFKVSFNHITIGNNSASYKFNTSPPNTHIHTGSSFSVKSGSNVKVMQKVPELWVKGLWFMWSAVTCSPLNTPERAVSALYQRGQHRSSLSAPLLSQHSVLNPFCWCVHSSSVLLCSLHSFICTHWSVINFFSLGMHLYCRLSCLLCVWVCACSCVCFCVVFVRV